MELCAYKIKMMNKYFADKKKHSYSILYISSKASLTRTFFNWRKVFDNLSGVLYFTEVGEKSNFKFNWHYHFLSETDILLIG